MFFTLEPEVAGGWGDETIVDTSIHPPVVKKLEYLFDGWGGDDLLTSFPCFIISETLANEIESQKYSGYELGLVKVSKSEQFRELYPDKELPAFKWLKINGRFKKDDFSISPENRLTVSKNALEVLKKFNLRNCEIEEM